MVSRMAVRLDEDDPKLGEYMDIQLPSNCFRVVGPRTGYGGAMREFFAAEPDHDCYGMMGDDSVPLTPRWDQTLRDAANRVNIAYPDDMINGETLATHCYCGGDFLRALGFWTLPDLTHLYTDTVLDYLGRLYGNLVYVPEVEIEHRHWSVGKAVHDETYVHHSAAKDAEAFGAWRSSYAFDPRLAVRLAA